MQMLESGNLSRESQNEESQNDFPEKMLIQPDYTQSSRILLDLPQENRSEGGFCEEIPFSLSNYEINKLSYKVEECTLLITSL